MLFLDLTKMSSIFGESVSPNALKLVFFIKLNILSVTDNCCDK